MEGIFTISLDFELHWGVFDKKDRTARTQCYNNTLQVIPQMLKSFAKHNVHVTWATVGALMAKDEKELNSLMPDHKPQYKNTKLSAYEWVAQNGITEQFYTAHFAPEVVGQIINYPGQELGTHTFSHYYCLENLVGADAFDHDLQAARKAAAKFKNIPVSLVFPRNQFNPQHLKTCYANGIKVIRTNPDNWFWTPIADEDSNLLRKVFRTGDAYLPLGKRTSYPLSSIKPADGQPIALPASRLLRSWNPKYKIANQLGLKRVLKEMEHAAQKKECYHLWWHPENFGDYPKENMENLHIILNHYTACQKKYGMTSWNMGEYAEQLN